MSRTPSVPTRSLVKWRSLACLALLSLCVNASAQPGQYTGPGEDGTHAPPPAVSSAGLDGDTRGLLEEMEREVRRTGGQALAVTHGDRLIHLWHEGELRPIELMSCTKSVVALAVGTLIDDGLLASDSVLVSELLPEFTGGRKDEITVRMLLDHTSGLAGAFSTGEIYAAESAHEYALASECEFEPGDTFRYNNNAVNLLMCVIERVSDRPADEYIAERVLSPLGITRWSWYRDPSGDAHGMAGLKLDAIDAARIGRLMLNEGAFEGRQIVSASWVRACVTPAHEIYARSGLLWWLEPATPWRVSLHGPTIERLRDSGTISAAQADAMLQLAGQASDPSSIDRAVADIVGGEAALADLRSALREQALRLFREQAGDVGGFFAQGYLGQLIIVFPESEVVVVRQQTNREADTPLDFDKMLELARGLSPATPR